jgi:hypothetical protein
MGNFYTNVTLRGVSPDAAATALQAARRRAFIAPAHAGGTTVYDHASESQDAGILGALALSLSDQLGCNALAVLNHDDDILALALYRDGALITEFETGHAGSLRVRELCTAWNRPVAAPIVWLLLQGPRPLFEVYRHAWLAGLLGLPPWSVGAGYRYLERGEVPSPLRPEDLIRVPR